MMLSQNAARELQIWGRRATEAIEKVAIEVSEECADAMKVVKQRLQETGKRILDERLKEAEMRVAAAGAMAMAEDQTAVESVPPWNIIGNDMGSTLQRLKSQRTARRRLLAGVGAQEQRQSQSNEEEEEEEGEEGEEGEESQQTTTHDEENHGHPPATPSPRSYSTVLMPSPVDGML